MNEYQKQCAQIERKTLHHLYGVMLLPLSEYGKYEIGETGRYTEYGFYYDDPKETEAERMRTAKQGAMKGAAYTIHTMPSELPFKEGRSRNIKFLKSGSFQGFMPELVEDKDFSITVTKLELPETEPAFTFDDIQPVKA